MPERVFVAMSGGVDSSLAALFLKEAGYEVSGIHLELSRMAKKGTRSDHADLERTCQLIDIPLRYLHLEDEFESRIIGYFCEEYSRGRTPNPCMRCNRHIKFGLLLDAVEGMGGDFLATGHYARVESSAAGYRLLKGLDASKDQSYFLHVLGQKELARALFPLGDWRKTEVKQLAARLNFPAAKKRESQDICFIPEGNHRAFLASHVASPPGEIVDIEGNVLGRHRGLPYYTVGQRQGTGVSAAERLYVIKLDPQNNRLTVGPESQLFKEGLSAYNLSWVSGKAPVKRLEVMARIRYRSPASSATVEVQGDRAEVHFAEMQRGIAIGQSVVFYQDDLVLGGGTIGETA
jgi:tRNA-specific 2-thiouridylase